MGPFDDLIPQEAGTATAFEDLIPKASRAVVAGDNFADLIPVAAQPTSNKLADAARRIPSGVQSGTGRTLAGAVRAVDIAATPTFIPFMGGLGPGAETINRLNQQMPAVREEFVRGRPQRLAESTAYQLGREIEQAAPATFGVDPARDNEFLAQLATAAGEMVPTLAAGAVAGPAGVGVSIGPSMGESQAQEAIAAGHPELADVAFISAAGLSAFTEAALGVPGRLLAMANRARKAGVNPGTFGRWANRNPMAAGIARAGAEGALREGAQEALEQAGGNLIASDVAGYDPTRPVGQGVGRAAALGATLGSLVGGGAAGVNQANRNQQAAALRVLRDGRQVIVNEQTGTTEFPPLEGDELPPPPPPAPPAGPANVAPPIRGESAMETRPSAGWTPDGPRTPAVDPELAAAIAAIRAGYNPEVDAPAPAPAPPSTFPEAPGVPAPLEGQPYEPGLLQRPEAAMETRRAAPLDLQREPAVSPELADAIAAVRAGYQPEVDSSNAALQAASVTSPTEEDYRGTHRAPSGDNGEGSLDAMNRTYPDDLYSKDGARLYGDTTNVARDRQMHRIIVDAKGKPDKLVTVYRAVPKGTGGKINPGDWVTPSKAYALEHGARFDEGTDILEAKVKAGDLFTEGNSIYEFGWSPKPLPKPTPPDQSGGPTELTPPAKGKDPAEMTAAAINKGLDKLAEEASQIANEFIAAGRGTELPTEYLNKTDPLSQRALRNFQQVSALRAEIETRYGPNAPSRLPTRGFPPRIKPSAVDSAIAALEAAKVKPGGLYSLPDLGLTVTLWNGTLTAAQVALRATRSLAQAVQAGVDWLRAQGQQFDEAKVRAALEQALPPELAGRANALKQMANPGVSPRAKEFIAPQVPYTRESRAEWQRAAQSWMATLDNPQWAAAEYWQMRDRLPGPVWVALGLNIAQQLNALETAARAAGRTAEADALGTLNGDFRANFVQVSTDVARTLNAYGMMSVVEEMGPFAADVFAQRTIEQASQKQKQRIKPVLDKGPDGEPGLADRLNEINRTGIEEAARTPEVQGTARTVINQTIEAEARQAGTPIQQAIAAEVVAQLQTAGRLNAVEAAIVREHFGQNPEPLALADKLERAGVKPAKARAAELEGKYKDGVEAFRAKLRQKLAEARQKNIDPATLGIVDRAIRQRLAELQVKLGALVRQHWTQQERVGQTLAESLVQEAGLPEAQATRLADAVQRRFKALVQARKEKALRNLAKTPAARELQKPTVAQRIIEATNLGALDSEGLWNAVAEKLGLPTYTAEASAEVKRLAERAQQLPEGSVQRRKATADMMNYIARRKGVKRGDLAWAFWYGNVLSDPRTWGVNFGDTGLNALASTAAVFTTEPGGVPQAIRQVPRAVGKGMAEAREVWRTGQDLRTHKEGDLSAPVLALYDRKAGFGPMMAWLYSNVGKVMTATDVFWQQATREMKAVQLARIMAKEEGLTGNALRLRVEEILNNTTERRGQLEAQLQREAAQMRAAGMEPDALWEQRRLYQLEEELRGPELEARANDFAARTAYNNEPYGVMGAVTNAIELGTRAMEAQAEKTGNERTAALASLARRFVIPFTRIPANAWNERLNYTPLGLARGTWAVLRARVMPDGQQRLYGREVQPGDVAEVLVKGAGGTLAMATLVLAGLKALDDEEGWQIHGAGPRNSDHRKTLRGTGWIPFSFQMGDKFVSFANTPFAAAFAMVGNYVDRHRYKDTDADGALNEARLAAMGAVQVFEQQTYIDAVSRTLGLLDNVNDKTPVRMAEVLGRGGASFVPVAGANVLRGVDRADDPKVYQAKTEADALLFGFPFVRRIGQPALNEFGEPVTLDPMARFYTTRKEDVLVDLVRRGIYPTKPNKAVNRSGREMTDDEHYRYVQESGQAIKRRLETPGMRQMIRSGKEEDARKAVTAIVREERERARRRLGF